MAKRNNRKKMSKGMELVLVVLVAIGAGMGWLTLDDGQTTPGSAYETTDPGQTTQGTANETPDPGQTTQGTAYETLEAVPAYAGEPFVTIADGVPSFTQEDLMEAETDYETYSELDNLGRCGPAEASVGLALMPTEKRGSISSVKPTGWVQNQYDWVDGKSLYNRCHLIGYQLSGENANWQNLITGTRYLNVDGMLPFENMVADYVKETGNHVLYRVTPVFSGEDLVARGVQMEARSVEDNGEGVEFNVFCYNVQPGVEIDYATGDNWAAEGDMAA